MFSVRVRSLTSLRVVCS